MRTIRIDEEVWAQLKKRAEPFVDAPNDVLRRLLGLDPVESSKERSARHRGPDERPRSQEGQFYRPILETLVELGGSATAVEVLEQVEKRTQGRFAPRDLELVGSGEIRWRNTAKWARKYMVLREKPPLLDPNSRHGWWAITQAGREYLERSGQEGEHLAGGTPS